MMTQASRSGTSFAPTTRFPVLAAAIGRRVEKSMNTNTDNRSEMDLFHIMLTKVRAGEPVHITLPTTEPLLRLHLGMINRLRTETGLPVHVIYN